MKLRSVIDYRFFIEAWILIHFAKLLILIFPFKKIAGLMGKANCETAFDNDSFDLAQYLENAIRRAARYSIHASKCYDQALAGKMMLKYRNLPSTIYFGLAKNEKAELIAHAWLRVGNRIITGKRGYEQYTVVASYVDYYADDKVSMNKNIDIK